MSGRRVGKKEVVRIDVDWLLSESTNPSERDFWWFRPTFVALICILIAVWSWPYASKEWLKWEWQQQLAHISGQHSEEVLPILLALRELNPSRTFEMVQEIGSADSSKRSVAFHLLEQRIQQWRGTNQPTASEMTELIDSLNSEHIRLPESILLRGQLAAQIRPLIRKDIPNATKLLASLDAMIIQSEPSSMSITAVANLPNLNIAIPRTAAKGILVQTPSVGFEPMGANVSSEDRLAFDTHEFNMISGIDKRNLENLMPLLASSQTRIVQQAFNEFVRRGMTSSHLDIAIELAQGNVEQRLKAMDAIARDPGFHDRIPWLVWMAESADRNVRRRAISLLGSMTDPEAMRKLRILQSREPDSTIADQISQVLLASGTASNSFR